MIELLPIPALTKTKNLDALSNSNAQNRADRQNRSKQEVGRKKQEARTDERPVSGSDTAAQCSLMCDGSLVLATGTDTGKWNHGPPLLLAHWQRAANLMAMELI